MNFQLAQIDNKILVKVSNYFDWKTYATFQSYDVDFHLHVHTGKPLEGCLQIVFVAI